MSLDLRLPMGLLFTIVGALLSVFGFFTRGSAIYARSADVNINLVWGLIMLTFGVAMLLLGSRTDRRPPAKPVQGTGQVSRH